ncbi:MAG: nitrogen regulation protein NR(II), partial [Calditrichia bacterium]
KFSISRKAVLLSPIRLNNLKEGVLIVFGGSTKNSGELSDAQKLTDLVAQKISRALELQNLRQDLLKKEQLSAIGQMMSTIVHDLRSPVNTIYGFIDLMESEQTSNEERIEFAEIIRQEIKAVLTMTTEILDFATGKTSVLPRKSSVRDVMKRFLPSLKEMCRKTNTELRMNDNSSALLYVDEEKLVRVFHNITKNALEAMGSGGKLQLDIFDESDYVIFIFKDNGPGIPAEIENKLFDSFVSSGKETGTGLGLAIVKKIIDEHNGVVEIDSVAGKGATVRIKLPVYQTN